MMGKKLLPICILAMFVMVPAAVSMGKSDGLFSRAGSNDSSERGVIDSSGSSADSDDCDDCYWKQQDTNSEPRGMESDVCYRCHNRVDEGEWAHGPIGAGQCVVCHDYPHVPGSLEALARESDALCFYCHDENRLQKHINSVNSRDCLSCHNPHSAEDNRLLW